MLRDAAVVGELFPPSQVASPKKYFAAAFSRAAEEWRPERLLSSALLPFASFLSYDTTAQFGKKSQTGFFVPIQSLENEGILYVFLVFQTEEVGQKDGGDSQTQLCGDALSENKNAAACQAVWPVCVCMVSCV